MSIEDKSRHVLTPLQRKMHEAMQAAWDESFRELCETFGTRRDTSVDERKTLLLAKLAELDRDEREVSFDTEASHVAADAALLDYIGDDDISAAFERLRKYYS